MSSNKKIRLIVCYFVSSPRLFAAVTSALSILFYHKRDDKFDIKFMFHVDYRSENNLDIKQKDLITLQNIFKNQCELIEVDDSFYKDIGVEENLMRMINNSPWHPVILTKYITLSYLQQADWVMYCDDDVICQNNLYSLLQLDYDVVAQKYGSLTVIDSYTKFFNNLLKDYPTTNFKQPIPIIIGWIFFRKTVDYIRYCKLYKEILIECIKKTEKEKLYFWPKNREQGLAWTEEILYMCCNSLLKLNVQANVKNAHGVPYSYDDDTVLIHSIRPGRYKFWGSNLTKRLCPQWELFYKDYLMAGGRAFDQSQIEYPHLIRKSNTMYSSLVCPSFWDNILKNNINLFYGMVYKSGIMSNILEFFIPYKSNDNLIFKVVILDLHSFDTSNLAFIIEYKELKNQPDNIRCFLDSMKDLFKNVHVYNENDTLIVKSIFKQSDIKQYSYLFSILKSSIVSSLNNEPFEKSLLK